MDKNLLVSVKQMHSDQQHPFVFQQDIAPCHRAMAVLAWFENNDRHNMLFRPQFPDVNPIKSIWSCVTPGNDISDVTRNKFECYMGFDQGQDSNETTYKNNRSFLYGEFGKIKDGRRRRSFHDRITMSILKTKLYLLALNKNKINVLVLKIGMTIKNFCVEHTAKQSRKTR